MRMGTPSISLNCLLGAFFFALAPDGEAMRVPSPAAGTMTKTFIGAISIVQDGEFFLARRRDELATPYRRCVGRGEPPSLQNRSEISRRRGLQPPRWLSWRRQTPAHWRWSWLSR